VLEATALGFWFPQPAEEQAVQATESSRAALKRHAALLAAQSLSFDQRH
jgi:hypothetical protein